MQWFKSLAAWMKLVRPVTDPRRLLTDQNDGLDRDEREAYRRFQRLLPTYQTNAEGKAA